MIKKITPKRYSVDRQEEKQMCLRLNQEGRNHPECLNRRPKLLREQALSLNHCLLRKSRTHSLNSWIVVIMKDCSEYMQCLLLLVRLRKNRFSIVWMPSTLYRKYTNWVSERCRTCSRSRLPIRKTNNLKSSNLFRSITFQLK